jgi:hypothetical protein
MTALRIKPGTARRLGLHAPTRDRRRAAKRRRGGRIDFGLIPPGSPGIAINQRPPEPVVRYVPIPYERGMLT